MKWIACTTRLPPDGVLVLIAYRDSQGWLCHSVAGRDAFCGDISEWVFEWSNTGPSPEQVTHWAHIPPLPKNAQRLYSEDISE